MDLFLTITLREIKKPVDRISDWLLQIKKMSDTKIITEDKPVREFKLPYKVEMYGWVLHDDSISIWARVIFSYLLALSQKNGYSTATNPHIARVFKLSTRGVSKYISELKKEKWIELHITWPSEKKSKRYITIRKTGNHVKNDVVDMDKNDVVTTSKSANHHVKNDVHVLINGNNKEGSATPEYFLVMRGKIITNLVEYFSGQPDQGRTARRVFPDFEEFCDRFIKEKSTYHYNTHNHLMDDMKRVYSAPKTEQNKPAPKKPYGISPC